MFSVSWLHKFVVDLCLLQQPLRRLRFTCSTVDVLDTQEIHKPLRNRERKPHAADYNSKTPNWLLALVERVPVSCFACSGGICEGCLGSVL
jgi:hypothetical protein